MRKSTMFFSIAMMLLTGNLFGKDIYIFFDDSCMESYEYEQIMQNSTKQIKENFQSYSIKINDNERIILEIGKLKTDQSADAPKATKYCGDIQYNELFARKINTKSQNVFMVIPSSDRTGYYIQQVHRAVYFFSTNSELGYSSPDATFAYNYSTTQKWGKKNFASKDSKNKVYFESRDDNYCPSKYFFKSSKKKRSKIRTILTLVPDIGLTSKVRSEDKNKSVSSKYVLKTINHIPLDKYMDAVCNGYVDYLKSNYKEEKDDILGEPVTTTTTLGNTTTTDGVIIANPTGNSISNIYKDLDKGFFFDRTTGKKAEGMYGGTSYHNGLRVASGSVVTTVPVTETTTYPTTTYPSTSTTTTSTPVYTTSTPATPVYSAPTVSTNQCGIEAQANHHVVQKGETLYRISKMYSVSINQLKKWNHIGRNNIIKVCSQLKIADGSVASYSYTTKGITTPSISTPTMSTPTPSIVASVAVPKSYSSTPATVIHTVQKGETLYSLSRRYGLTIEKLKSINGLTSNNLNIGQVLNISSPSTSSTTTTIIAVPASYNTTSVAPSDFTAKGASTASPTVKWDAIPKAVSIPESYSNNFTAKGGIDIIPQKGIRNIHIVQDSETIFSIAKMYNRNVKELSKLNKLNKNEIIIPGQKLYLD